jgi:type VI secretion system protein ImpE
VSPQELVREGNVDEALAALQQQVRTNPADAKLRTFLFQLLCVQGQWDRALNQLNVSAEIDPIGLAMAQTYREALRCEAYRQSVFAGEHTPLVLGEPPPWIGLLVQAIAAKGAAAEDLRAQAFDQAPASGGSLDGHPFEWLADADPRLGPVLEAIVNGRYYWIPLTNIQAIDFEKPEDLRDFVWLPAHFTWTNGGEAVGLIPARYPGSESHADPHVRLGRKTLWDGEQPIGQRMLITDGGEFALLDVRRVEFQTAEPEPGSSASEA